MQAASQDSVLIEQVVHCASKARVATGQEPIYDLPKGTPNASTCPVARAFNINCSVTGSSITFREHEQAQLIAEALNLAASGTAIHLPEGHPIRLFVSRFDNKSSKRLSFFRA